MRILWATEGEGLKCPVCGQAAMGRQEKLAVGPINPSLPWWIASGLGLGLWFVAYAHYWPRTPLVVAKGRS